jgi:iron complex outermembrane recepter protein
LDSFRPEALTSYEAGATWHSPSGAIALAGDLFHYHYQDFQTLAADQEGRTYTFNVEAAESGAELTLHAQPIGGLSLELGSAYLHAIEKNVAVAGRLIDQPMPFAPKWRLTSSLRYEFGCLGGQAAIQADWQHTTHKSILAIDYPFLRIPEQDVIDAEISWTTIDERVTIAARVDNLTDTPVIADRLDLTGLAGGVGNLYGPPRWARLTVTYKF